MSQIYRLTHPLRPNTATCIISDREDLVDLACYILIKAGGYNGPLFDGWPFNTSERAYSLLQALLSNLGEPLNLNNLAYGLHHMESLALDYCNRHYLDEPLALQTDRDIDLWNPALLDALQRCQQDAQASKDKLLQDLIALTHKINLITFIKETCFLPFLMLRYSNHAHLAKVLETMEVAQQVADPEDDASVIDVDLQQALEARKVWQLSPKAESLPNTHPEYDTLLLNEAVATLMDEECWMVEWRLPESQAGHAIYGPEQQAGTFLHRLSGKR